MEIRLSWNGSHLGPKMITSMELQARSFLQTNSKAIIYQS